MLWYYSMCILKNKWVIGIYIKGILSMHTTDVIGNEVALMTNKFNMYFGLYMDGKGVI